MKTKKSIIVAMAVVVLAFFSCGEEPGGNDNAPQLPSALQNTNWVHSGGDKVQFGTNTVTVIPASGSSRTFTLNDSVTVSELSQTTLYFGDSQTSDFIVYRNGTINSVGLGGVQKTGGWEKYTGSNPQPTRYTITFNAGGGTVSPTSKQVNSGNPAGDLPTPTRTNYTFGGWYTAQNGGGAVFSSETPVTASITVYAKWTIIEAPVARVETRQLTEANWKAILTEIETAGKYVNLDLSLCTRSTVWVGGLRSDGYFDPITDFSTGKSKIVSLILPNTATTIASYFSNHFSSLESVRATGVTNIGDAFSGCTSLTSVDFPAATTIGYGYSGAFSRCTSLTSVNLPLAATISTSAFYGCTSLTSVSLPVATNIGGSAFYGCTSLTSVNFPAATSIGGYAFYGCTSLTSVSLPVATSIGDYAFHGCTSLTSVSLPAATYIDHGAFGGCTSLTNVNLPAVTDISYSAFSSTGTTALTITLGPNAPTLLDSIFYGISSAKSVTVKVPSGATGYGTVPTTYSGNDTTENWGNGFRGGGWDGSGFDAWGIISSYNINSNITLIVEYR